MIHFEFELNVTDKDAIQFAQLSGDWNPLHTDSKYAAKTIYRQPILHGAYSAGLFSRMAGMHIPGRNCLLHDIKLKFLSPIFLPARLKVRGTLLREIKGEGLVEVVISNFDSGVKYVVGSYSFGRHDHVESSSQAEPVKAKNFEAPILVTGASGSLGRAVLKRLGSQAIAISRSVSDGIESGINFADIENALAGKKIGGIVHCGWPSLDNQSLLELGGDIEPAIQFNLAKPLEDCIKLSQLLAKKGLPGSSIILIGSTAAYPGRHNWRMPIYSLAKSLIPTLVKILAVEFGSRNLRSIGVVFDVIDGGMSAGMRDAVKMAHIDRTPTGVLPSPDEAADQIAWILNNKSSLVSGALINLSGGALP